MLCHQAHFLACAIPLLLEAGKVGFEDLLCPGLRAELCLADPDVRGFGQGGVREAGPVAHPQGGCQSDGETCRNPHGRPDDPQEFSPAPRGTAARLLSHGTANSVLQVGGGRWNGGALVLQGLMQFCPGAQLRLCGVIPGPVRGHAIAVGFGIPAG
ncbi:MAG: hypothetical protein KatS3mg132_146 [Limisphaera sp.]|nr:MAG: hypothetical protein KatS3mg132_146 [Limisphaera sp.]